jgi:hypothetical protein
MGVLVIRASVEHDPQRRLVVQVIEVNSTAPDRVIGAVGSSKAAARLVAEWLDSLDAAVPSRRAAKSPAPGPRDTSVMPV